jgi:chromate transporter
MMEHEIVRVRAWLTREQFLDYLAAANMIPGPNSTELAIHLGHARAGWRGLIVAGVSFIAPGAALVGILAWAYMRYERLPELQALLGGIKPVVVAIIAQALWSLSRTAITSRAHAAIALLALAAILAGSHELAVLAGAGLGKAAARHLLGRGGRPSAITIGATAIIGGTAIYGTPVTAGALAGAGSGPLLLVFLKIGSVVFGSGYVLLAFMRADLVERLRWLSEQQLLDAIAVGQMTPGPLFTAATFVGYVLGGAPGAVAATVGIFLPAFVFVAASGPLIPRLRQSRLLGAAFDGVVVASLAMMAVVSWQLGRASLGSPFAVILALVSGVALVRYRVNSAWLIAAGALAGFVAGWRPSG